MNRKKIMEMEKVIQMFTAALTVFLFGWICNNTVAGAQEPAAGIGAEYTPKIELSFPESAVHVGNDTFFSSGQMIDILGSVWDETGIARIEYRSSLGNSGIIMQFSPEDAEICTEYNGSLKQGSLEEELNGLSDGVYSYTFTVTNNAGKAAEAKADFKVDRTNVSDTIYVEYEGDGTNKDQLSGTDGAVRFLDQSFCRLFGKTYVRFKLYVKDQTPDNGNTDTISGIDTEDLKCQITANGDMTAVIIGDSEESLEGIGEGFTCISGIVRKSSGSDVSSAQGQLKIRRLKDMAGNTAEQIHLFDITGAAVMYIDNEAPVFHADYKSGIADDDHSRVFYGGAANIGLNLKEAFYDRQTDKEGNAVAPTVKVTGDPVEAEAWKWDADSLSARSKLIFPAVPGSEKEYVFSVRYMDGSGNLLETDRENSKGMVTNGIFTGYKIITDNRAPELTACSVSGTIVNTVEGAPVYENKGKQNQDVKISFDVDDNNDYWNPSALTFSIQKKTDGESSYEPVVTKTGSELDWNVNGRIHGTSLGFRGEEGVAAVYRVQISYADRAGNKMILNSPDSGSLSEGIYTSEEFILDHRKPEFDISYNKAYRLVKEKPDAKQSDIMEAEPRYGYTAYYGTDIDVTFTIKEEEAVFAAFSGGLSLGLKDYELHVSGKKNPVYTPDIFWEQNGNIYTGTFRLTEEDSYSITMFYQDPAKNKMTGTAAGGNVEEGTYSSSVLVIDKTAPVITTAYIDRSKENKLVPKTVFNSRSYFDQAVYLQVNVEDENVRRNELKKVMENLWAFDSSGTTIEENIALSGSMESDLASKAGFICGIDLSAEANYNIPVGCEDLAGNKARVNGNKGIQTLKICVDITEPQFDISYEVSPPGFYSAVNYKKWGYIFSDSRMRIRLNASDAVAGVRYITFEITDESGKKERFRKEVIEGSEGLWETELPLHTEDFKGTVKAEVEDRCSNRKEIIRSHIVESTKMHENTAEAVIKTLSRPSRTVGGKDFYNSDVYFQLLLKDGFSGLHNFKYEGGNTLYKEKDYQSKAGTDMTQKPIEDITWEYSENLSLAAVNNNQNNVKVEAEFTDNAGHGMSVRQYYNIDTAKPVVTVEYDQNKPSNGKYYNKTRTAVVTIRERNFDENDVEFFITNTGKAMPYISEWRHGPNAGDDTIHTCRVVFEEDGDYTFHLTFMDLAGNVADYDRIDEFTIDKTRPRIEVTYDNNEYLHDYYYNKSRTATVDVEEHNFDPENIEVIITADDGVEVPMLSGWRKDGDHHYATAVFSAEAEYTFDIRGRDLAENSMDEYETDHFVVDKTPPLIQIFDVFHMSANSGVVRPKIRCSDSNFDPETIRLSVEGCHNGIKERKENRVLQKDGVEILLDDFEHVPQEDDLYVMKAASRDLAGNIGEAEVIFSVNRFGSVYFFDEKTEELVGENGKYYTNKEQDIVITETNVDTLEFREITCRKNGKIYVLQEGVDFTVRELGDRLSWKQYKYCIGKHNFTDEGTYLLTIYSEDRASNASDNNAKGKKIEFVIDKTSPSILISGVEHDGHYRENSREVTLDVQDNIRVSEIRVKIDEKEKVYSTDEIMKKDGKITFSIGSKNNWQKLTVTAFDAAGNQKTTEELRFLISPNFFVQLFMNKILFGSILALIICGFITAGAFLIMKKRD